MRSRKSWFWFLLCSLISVAVFSQAPMTDQALEAAGLESAYEEQDANGAAVAGRGPTVVEAMLIAQDGDMPAGTTGSITTLSVAFTNGNGQPGFTGNTDTSNNFVWSGAGVIWANSDAMSNTLTGAEAFMGIGNSGEFIYSPSTDGDDSVWTHNGLLEVENVQAPGFAAGTNSTFHSRPTMTPSGNAYWVAGFDDTGGTSTQGRVLYRNDGGRRGATAVVIRSDDMVDGLAIDRPSGVQFDYDISDNGMHHIHDLQMDTGSTATDGAVYFNGSLVARESLPTGDGDNWDNFDVMSVNDSGNYLFSGDTDGATTSDEFIAYNGAIVLREGDTVDGVALASSATVRGLSINNLGQAVHLWGISGGAEILFVASDASDLANTSVAFLATGDGVDLDGDNIADAIVDDFKTFGKSFELAGDERVMVEVDLDYGTALVEAILALDATGVIPVELQSFSVE